jgi:endo-1,4-beta-xylanase
MLINRRNLLLGIGGFSVAGLIATENKSRSDPARYISIDGKRRFEVRGSASLGDRAKAKGLFFGATTHRRTLETDSEFASKFVDECTMLVPEGELKWNSLRASPNRFDFRQGDWMVQFAQSHNLLIRGHTLVWHDGLPPWFRDQVTPQNAEQVMLNHVTTVVRHYAGKIHSWDVVNEAILPHDNRPDGLRKTPWLKFLGPGYIDLAFRAAAAADPQALLVYNDHWLEYDTAEGENRRVAVLKLLTRLKAKGTPIHALGIQSHLLRDVPRFNPIKFRKFLTDVSRLGLKIMITEMDVTDQRLPGNPVVRDRMVAAAYEDYLTVVLEQPAVIAVLTWGLSDRYTWLTKGNPRSDGLPVRPLPLDANLKRKLAWNAIARSLDRCPKR